MINRLRITVPLTVLALLSAAAPAHAAELFGGVYKHAVHSPFSLEGGREQGVDLQLGFRGGRLFPGLGLQPYVFGAFNTAGDTSYAAAGLSWRSARRCSSVPASALPSTTVRPEGSTTPTPSRSAAASCSNPNLASATS